MLNPKRKQGPARLLDVEDLDLLIQYEIPEGEEATDALDRLRAEERRLFGQIQAIEKLLCEAPNAKLDRQLSMKGRQWIEASKGATAVWRVIKSLDAGKELEEALTAADKYIELTFAAVFYWLRAFPSKFPAEKGREEALKAVRDIFSKLPNLLENHFAKSGLEDLHKRAFDIVEAAKAEAEKQLEKDHAS